MATFDNYHNSDPDQQHFDQSHQHENVLVRRTSSGQQLSFERSGLTSDSGGGRRFSSGAYLSVPVGGVAEGQTTGTNWEAIARDLSRRPNIHRSHLSSSIQTGTHTTSA